MRAAGRGTDTHCRFRVCNSMDITQQILDEHHQQRQMFADLDEAERGDHGALASLWQRLANFLEVHAAAEEAVFYPHLLGLGTGANDANSAEDETADAIDDHNGIRKAVSEVGSQQMGSTEWWAAVNAARVANSEHMAEEERQGLADFRQHADTDTRHKLAVRFAEFVHAHADGVQAEDQDPDRYLREHS